MASNSPASIVLGLAALCMAGAALDAKAGQPPGQDLAERCDNPSTDPTSTAILGAVAKKEKRDALASLDQLEGPVRAAFLAAPEDVTAQFHLAALLGARAERDGGRKKMAAAKEMRPITIRVLTIEPDHAGANFLIGRLHAAVMRLDGVTRFLATHVLGGSTLKEASWEGAQRALEAAERLAPCVPEHHYELARLYAERKQPDAAERERQHVLELTAGDQVRWAEIRNKASRLSRR